MEQVSINKNMKLSQHFSLGELTKSNHPEVYNIPSHTAIENLKRICENWLEDLRYSYNMLYVHTGVRHTGVRPQSKVAGDCTLAPDPRPAGSTLVPDPGAAPEEPIIINSGYRSPEVNLLAGGATNAVMFTPACVFSIMACTAIELSNTSPGHTCSQPCSTHFS